MLTVENTGETLTPRFVSTLDEPFRRGSERIRTDHAGVGLGWRSPRASPEHTTEPSRSSPETAEGFASPCDYPPHRHTLTRDDRGIAANRRDQGLPYY
jgi:two-component system sensor histidine kinase VanS